MIRALKFITLFRALFGNKDLNVQKIEKMGLLAVKISQMYATRSDLLSVQKCRQLQDLYESTTAIPWAEVKGVLKSSVPQLFWEEVKEINEEPLAAASLGQVHRAKHIDGTEVVIKVIKPRAQRDFEKDLNAVKFLAKCAVTFYPKLKRLADPMGTIETIARLTRTELDLRNESKGTNRLQEIRDHATELPHLKKLHFPSFYDQLSSQNVLVSEFLPQKSVSKGIKDGTFTYSQLLNLFRTQGYYLFKCAEFHGDLHPGNIFFNEDELWWLDNANIEKTDPTFTRGLLRFLGELGKENFQGAAAVMESLSLSPPQNQEKYYQDFKDLYAEFSSGTTSLTNQMMGTVKLCVHAGMEFPEGAFPVIKSLMYLDGIALECAPEARLLEDVLQYTSDLS